MTMVMGEEFLKDVGLVVSKTKDLLDQIKGLNKIGKDTCQRVDDSIVRTLATIGIIEEHRRVGVDTTEAENLLIEMHDNNKRIYKALVDMKRFFC